MSLVIGIPVYKERLNRLEEVSLLQVDRILHRYKKVFIAPEKININYAVNYEIIRFHNRFFENKNSYSELLLTSDFYACFNQYKYLLIYQLDAFVFFDKLKYFCNLGFDFIGATMKGGDWEEFHVGNGGLSLRNIRKCKKILARKDEIQKRIYPHIISDYIAEDIFWAYCGWDDSLDFKVPSPREACRFSVQNDSYRGMRDIEKRGLPFGCHYWYIHNYEFWRPYVESYGYKLEPRYSLDSRYWLCKQINMKLLQRYLRCVTEIRRELEVSNFMRVNICLFGAGKECARYLKLLREISKLTRLNLLCILDNNPSAKSIYGIPIRRPELGFISDNKAYVLISSIKYEHEIAEQLSAMKLKEDYDYCSIYKMCENILKYNFKYYVDTKNVKLAKGRRYVRGEK